jgi:superfamily II DNA helicase RecQ
LNEKPNQQLFDQLMAWRDTAAEKENIMPGMVLSEKTVATIAEKLPPTIKVLGAIKGVGPQKATQYGPQLIAMIRSYLQETLGAEMEQGNLF